MQALDNIIKDLMKMPKPKGGGMSVTIVSRKKPMEEVEKILSSMGLSDDDKKKVNEILGKYGSENAEEEEKEGD